MTPSHPVPKSLSLSLFDLTNELINKLNEMLDNENKIQSNKIYKHKELNKMIDSTLKNKLTETLNQKDMARINSISDNGATSWLDITPNNTYGKIYSNKQYVIALSMYLGVPLITKDSQCLKCGEVSDKYGIHAIHCKYHYHCINRHNQIRDLMKECFEKAGFECLIEQKMNDNDNIIGTPGDLKVLSYDINNNDIYFDLSIVNVNAESYVSMAAKERLGAAKHKEKHKIQKYNNQPNFIPLILESYGAMGPLFRKTLQRLAHKIAVRRNEMYATVVNRLRTRVIAELIYHNSIMIESSIEM